MKYLGIDIEKIHCGNKTYWKCEKMTSNKLREVKQYIRKIVLPTYQLSKTLKWLEEQTGFKWVFNNIFNELHVNEDNQRWIRCYDFVSNTAFVSDEKIGITTGENGEWVEMTPREFIERIAKGEWE